MNCAICGTTFTPIRRTHVYCSVKCRKAKHRVPKGTALWRHNRNEQMWRMRQQGTR